MDRFTFFRSFHDSLQDCPPDIRLEVYDAITGFCFDDKEPDFAVPMSRAIWKLVRPILDNAKKQSRNGSKGGAKIGNTNACKAEAQQEEQPKNNPKTSQNEPKTSQNEPPPSNGIWNMEYRDNSLEESIYTPSPEPELPLVPAIEEDERYTNFKKWIVQNAPYCSNPKNLKQMTQDEFLRIRNKYTSEQIMETILDLENRKDKRKQYTNLYRTLINWMKTSDGNK